MSTQNEPFFDYVKRKLESTKGRWPDVAQGSGVPISTLRKIAQGRTTEPSVSKVQALYDYFQRTQVQP